MSVRIAKSAGFCFGVSRAVELVEQAAAAGKKVATLGPIIHNRHVVNKFEEMGVRVIEVPEEARPDETVIIRSHGASREVVQRLEKTGAEIIDATCPFVKRIHTIVSRAEEEGKLPVIIGTPTHPEVEGIAGWCSRCRIRAGSASLSCSCRVKNATGRFFSGSCTSRRNTVEPESWALWQPAPITVARMVSSPRKYSPRQSLLSRIA